MDIQIENTWINVCDRVPYLANAMTSVRNCRGLLHYLQLKQQIEENAGFVAPTIDTAEPIKGSGI